jgi:hypothetical protein
MWQEAKEPELSPEEAEKQAKEREEVFNTTIYVFIL